LNEFIKRLETGKYLQNKYSQFIISFSKGEFNIYEKDLSQLTELYMNSTTNTIKED